MIGYYNYTVVLTYISLASSVFGMTQAIHGRFKTAILCLAISGLCDMFDGKIARTKKDRTEDEKAFGIQIDSLCDVVCFGAFPALICYLLGVRGPIGIAAIILYCVNSVVRLAYFNVMEAKNALVTEGRNTTAGCRLHPWRSCFRWYLWYSSSCQITYSGFAWFWR